MVLARVHNYSIIIIISGGLGLSKEVSLYVTLSGCSNKGKASVSNVSQNLKKTIILNVCSIYT